jgi:hypothetical protein
MDGIVDIYISDFKLWSEDKSESWLKADDYPAVAKDVIRVCTSRWARRSWTGKESPGCTSCDAASRSTV